MFGATLRCKTCNRYTDRCTCSAQAVAFIEPTTVEAVVLKWYHFSQNNSGGYFIVDDEVANDVFIQERNVQAAVSKAEDLFADRSQFCDCCGQRWSTSYIDESDGHPVPMIYGEPYTPGGMFRDEARLHYFDGRIEKVNKDNPPTWDTPKLA
jgi:hypothetical protein